MEDNIKIYFTVGKLVVKNLRLTENKKFIVGKVQNKMSMTDYISTKWEINKETKICTTAFSDDPDYRLSIDGVYIPGLYAEEVKPVKNFYTFNKDAWHCKLYKWVYGKEPHKVHPTMCPYFWIMVITLLPPVFMIVLISKLFGAAGTKFMHQCATYKERKKQRLYELSIKREKDWVENIKNTYHKLTGPELEKLLYSDNNWEELKWRLGDEVKGAIQRKFWDWKEEERVKKVERQQQAELLRIALEASKPKKIVKPKVKKVKPKGKQFNIDSKTAKIIGIGLIVICCGFVGYGLSIAAVKAYYIIPWKIIGYILLSLIGAVLAGVAIYGFIVYVLIPLFHHAINPFFDKVIVPSIQWFYYKVLVPFGNGCVWVGENCIGKPFKYVIVEPACKGLEKLEDNEESIGNFFRSIGKGFEFLAFILSYPFIMLYHGFIHAKNFFSMCKDLIYQMYKKNCPRITWTGTEEEN